ncbi:MAG: hypothetical protein M3261_08210, partial [Thermoproteota archaeon]|nr:hypothetical protein [Thermoproteota archaeon]
VIHAGKSKQKTVEVVKVQSLQKMVLRKFHYLNNREVPQHFYTVSTDNRYLILDNTLFKLFLKMIKIVIKVNFYTKRLTQDGTYLSMLLKISIT